MSVLLWWAIPIGSTLATILWFAFRNRAVTPEQQRQGIAEMEAMRSALAKPLPNNRR